MKNTEPPADDKDFLDAVDFERTGKYNHAVSMYSKITDSYPDNIEALRGIARCVLAAANWRMKEKTEMAYECSKKILDLNLSCAKRLYTNVQVNLNK